ncbi:hypothetical protein [Alcaligenes faecalis]|uniref:hypothetical protein n=1 Tax=Alcaligenes faecalis TaxID=511 RepID=UPI0024BC8B19|nr:hypothetical protein [Alcaligenes faecalis]WHQ45921.1 hypothetical protein E8D21_19930 [Alcaligenes faecalis]
MKIDVEKMLVDCVPVGSIVDPQVVADNIRAWFDKNTHFHELVTNDPVHSFHYKNGSILESNGLQLLVLAPSNCTKKFRDDVGKKLVALLNSEGV